MLNISDEFIREMYISNKNNYTDEIRFKAC